MLKSNPSADPGPEARWGRPARPHLHLPTQHLACGPMRKTSGFGAEPQDLRVHPLFLPRSQKKDRLFGQSPSNKRADL